MAAKISTRMTNVPAKPVNLDLPLHTTTGIYCLVNCCDGSSEEDRRPSAAECHRLLETTDTLGSSSDIWLRNPMDFTI